MRTFFVALTGVFALLYMINPTAGIFELIPDNLPVVGNLDEAGATALIIAVLGYFGIDFLHMFVKKEGQKYKKPIKEAEVDEF